MLSQENPAGTRMTATEVAERHEEKMLMLGPRARAAAQRAAQPADRHHLRQDGGSRHRAAAPEELQGEELNVELVSILAQAQRAIATNSVDRFVGNLGMAELKPEVLDKLDFDAWADSTATCWAWTRKLVVDDDKVSTARARAKAQPQAQQAAQAEQQAKTAQTLATTPRKAARAATCSNSSWATPEGEPTWDSFSNARQPAG
jgi:hypothetical protein